MASTKQGFDGLYDTINGFLKFFKAALVCGGLCGSLLIVTGCGPSVKELQQQMWDQAAQEDAAARLQGNKKADAYRAMHAGKARETETGLSDAEKAELRELFLHMALCEATWLDEIRAKQPEFQTENSPQKPS